ncbi:MAG: efflux RND transporter periplasmic adaptor subunit [Thermodesulfobacteriota bacterium]
MVMKKKVRSRNCGLLTGIIPALFIFFISTTGCQEKPKQGPPPPPAVTIAQPVKRTVTDSLDLTGNTQAVNTVQLVARVAGYLEKVFFRDGQSIKKGDLLFLIQQNTYQENLRQAEAAILLQKTQLEYAQIQLDRNINLVKQNAASKTDVDNWRNQRDSAQANLQGAQAQRDLAKLNLDYTEVRAPMDGRIDRRLVDTGNLVGSNQTTVLAQLSQINPIYVYFTISDLDLARLTGETRWTPGQALAKTLPVYMGLPNEKEFPHKGTLDFAAISLTPTNGTLLMRGVFSNPQGKILPGLFARVKVPIKEKRAFLVPQEALGTDQRGSYVLVVTAGNVVNRLGVRAGMALDNLRVIEEGLTGTEWIVVKGLQKAVPGRRVTPQKLDLQTTVPATPPSRDPKKAGL